MDKLTKERFECNMVLIDILKEYLKEHKDIRFSQALSNLDFVKKVQHTNECGDEGFEYQYWKDEFYLESKDLLKRIKI